VGGGLFWVGLDPLVLLSVSRLHDLFCRLLSCCDLVSGSVPGLPGVLAGFHCSGLCGLVCFGLRLSFG